MNGRRLVVLPAVRREDVEKARAANKVRQSEQDKKSLHLLKEGLTNVQDFVLQGVADADMKKRLQYAADKEDNLKKNPNYIVSRTRKQCMSPLQIGLRVRNLPKRDYTAAMLKELFASCIEEYAKGLPKDQRRKVKGGKPIKQVLMRLKDR